MATPEQIRLRKRMIESIENVNADDIKVSESSIDLRVEKIDVTNREDSTKTYVPGKQCLNIVLVFEKKRFGMVPCCPRLGKWIDTNQIFKNIAGSYTVPALNDTINHCPFCGTKLKYRGMK